MLIWAAQTLTVDLDGTANSDLLNVNGGVDLTGATLTIGSVANLNSGDKVVVVANGGTLTGTFNGLSEGDTFTQGGEVFSISYIGGDGDDVELTYAGAVETDIQIDGSGNLIITDAPGDTTDDSLVITVTDPNPVTGYYTITSNTVMSTGEPGLIRDDANTIRVPFSELTAGGTITFNGGDGTDMLTIDLSSKAGRAFAANCRIQWRRESRRQRYAYHQQRSFWRGDA